MHSNMRRGHDALWRKFFNPETNLIYDCEFTEASQYPTPEEVARSHPSCAGWGTGMEDCTLTAGFVLDAMLAAHRMTGEAEWADKARKIFTGLAALGTVSGVPGYVARGFAPGRTDVYPNSSADQYTSFVYGVWRYAASSAATEDERDTATRLLVDVAKFVEAFGHTIPRLDGRPSIYGDTDTIEPGRACRILQFYKAAFALSGDEHWHDLYRLKVNEHDRARPRCHYGPEVWDLRRNIHAVAQSQIAFRLLYETETDPELKKMYRHALEAEARSVIGRLELWREIVAKPLGKALPPRWRPAFAAFLAEHPDYDPAEHEQVSKWHGSRREHESEFPPTKRKLAQAKPALPGLRHQTETLAIVMLCENEDLKRDAARVAGAMLTEIDWTLVAGARDWECLDLGYWRGVESGVFPNDE